MPYTRPGHVRDNCYKLNPELAPKKSRNNGTSSVQFVSVSNNDSIKSENNHDAKSHLESLYNQTTISTIGWDRSLVMMMLFIMSRYCETVAHNSLLSKEKVSDLDYQDTGEFRLIQGIGGSVLTIPLIEVRLSTKLGNGSYLFGLTGSLPDSFFDEIIGNDLDTPEENIVSNPVSVGTRSQTAVSQNQASRINKDNLTNIETKSRQVNLTTTSNKGDKQVVHEQQSQNNTHK